MMHIHFPRRFPYKAVALCTAVLLLLVYGAALAALYYAFSPQRINSLMAQTLGSTGRHTTYGSIVRRSLFPRPTVELSDVRISSQNNPLKNDIRAQRMIASFGWSSIFGRPRIEKWTWKQADIAIYPLKTGHWNFDDFKAAGKSGALPLNRLILSNSTLYLSDTGGRTHRIGNLDLRVSGAGKTDSVFTASGSKDTANGPLIWQLAGTAANNGKMLWHNAELTVRAVLPGIGAGEGKWQFDGSWQADPLQFTANNVRWQWKSGNHLFSAEGSGRNWVLNADTPSAGTLTAVVTAVKDGNRVDGTLELSDLKRTGYLWDIRRFRLSAAVKNNSGRTALSLSGHSSVADNGSWTADELSISSYQENTQELPDPRFIAELQGSISGSQSELAVLELQGTFDNSPIKMNAAYRRNTGKPGYILAGTIRADSFNVRPYLPGNLPLPALPGSSPADNNSSASERNGWERLLKTTDTDLNIEIGHVDTPVLRADNVKGRFTADSRAAVFVVESAELYGGRSSGSIRWENTRPLQWQWQQQFDNIDIKPLLQDSLGLHNIEGRGTATVDLLSKGRNHEEWLQNLQGKARLNLTRGMLRGLDINNVLQSTVNRQALPFNKESFTAFRTLRVGLDIENGVSADSRFALHADNFDVTGKGFVSILDNKTDLDVLINTRGQNNRNILPLKVRGDLDNPGFTVDYSRLTAGLNSPEEKHEVLKKAFSRQWEWMNEGAASGSRNTKP